jgi:peptidoglycan/LPS O-acetylase OafA/YrhL
MKYRSDIDGLRAIAVIPVILFHAGVSTFSGGFLGVDIFFVISGYLITSILLNEKQHNQFSLIHFYNRRARRILPPLCLMLFISSIFAYFLMIPSQLGDYGQSLVASLAFLANIYFWIKTNYWGQSAELTPLIHVWSLGVEEQFYLLFPIILMLFRGRKQIFFALLLIGIISFISMLFFYNQDHISEVFYLLPFRMWELIAGSISAILTMKLLPSEEFPLRNILSIAAFFALSISLLIFDRQTHPALLYPIPILAGCILVSSPKGLTAKALSCRPIVYIGSISYGLYLFHQPALAFTRIYTFGNPSAFEISGCLSLTLILAALSYKFLESPIKRGQISPKIFYSLTFSVILILISFGTYLTITQGLRTYKFSKMNSTSVELFKRLEVAKQSRHDLWEGVINESSSPFLSTKGRKILFLGDSMSEDLYISSIEHQKKTKDQNQYKRLKLDDACFQFLTNTNHAALPDPSCRGQIDALMRSDLLKNSTDIVIANLWEATNVGTISNIFALKEVHEKNIIYYAAPTFTDMTSLLYYLSKSGEISQDSKFKNFIYRNRNERRISINNAIQAAASKNKAFFINAFEFYCSDTKRTCVLFDENGAPWIIDGMHLSANGVSFFSPWLAEKINQSELTKPVKSN